MSLQLLRVMLSLACLRVAIGSTFNDSKLFDGDVIILHELLTYFQPCDSCFSGPPIPPSKKWSLSTDPCNHWYGVGCTKVGNNTTVTSLKFPPYYLNGSEVAPSIMYLYNLTSIDLSIPDGFNSCNFYVDLPYWLVNLTKLKVIDASRSYIYNISYLPNVTLLRLSSASMVDDSYIPLVSSLRTLDISRNYFTEFPGNIRDLVNLTFLNVSMNVINKIPGWLSELTSLEVLDIGYGNFSGPIPDVLRDIPKVYVRETGFDGSNDSCVILLYGNCLSSYYENYLEWEWELPRAGYYGAVSPEGSPAPSPSWDYYAPQEWDYPPYQWYSPPSQWYFPQSPPSGGSFPAMGILGAVTGLMIVVCICVVLVHQRHVSFDPPVGLVNASNVEENARDANENSNEDVMIPVTLLGSVIGVAKVDRTVLPSEDERK